MSFSYPKSNVIRLFNTLCFQLSQKAISPISNTYYQRHYFNSHIIPPTLGLDILRQTEVTELDDINTLRENELTLQTAARLLESQSFDELKHLLKPYTKERIERRRKNKHDMNLLSLSPDGFTKREILFIQRYLHRVPRHMSLKVNRYACVVIQLCNVNGVASILFEKRYDKARIYHTQEVCFPGSMMEDWEELTSLRQIEVELGVKADDVLELGIFRCDCNEVVDMTGISVTPMVEFIGELSQLNLRANPDETKHLFTISCDDLLNESKWTFSEFSPPMFSDGNGIEIWGFTAYLLNKFLKDVVRKCSTTLNNNNNNNNMHFSSEFYKANSKSVNFLHDFSVKSSIPETEDLKSINCHRFMLASQSPYFAAYFRKHSCTQSLELEFSSNSLNSCIEFMYTGETEINNENSQELIEAASYFQIEALISRLSVFLLKQLDISNSLDLLELVDRLSLSELQRKCVIFIAERMSEIIIDNGDRIYQLPEYLFNQIICSDDLVLRTSCGVPYRLDLMPTKVDEIWNEYYICNPNIKRPAIRPGSDLPRAVKWTDVTMPHRFPTMSMAADEHAVIQMPSFHVDLSLQSVMAIEVHVANWDTVQVVKALKFTYRDGSSVTCGLADSEGILVHKICIEPDEHIASIFGVGFYFDSFGIRTSKNVVHGPFGGPGGHSFDTARMIKRDNDRERDFDPYDNMYPDHLKPCIVSMSGKVMTTKGLQIITRIEIVKRLPGVHLDEYDYEDQYKYIYGDDDNYDCSYDYK